VTTYNAALNKPAFQSSVAQGGFPRVANDGRRATWFWRSVPQCAHSKKEMNPWWAVDLLEPTTVYSVVLTNRQDNGMIMK